MDLTNFDVISLVGVKNVFIDLDNTLYAYEPSHSHALHACYLEFLKYKLIDREEFTHMYRHARKEVTIRLSPQGACRSRLLAFLSMFEKLDIKGSFSMAEMFDEFYWEHFISSMRVSQKGLNFLKRCKEHQIPVCVVSDMITNIQIKKIRKLRLDMYVDRLVTSEETGAEKPHPIMFKTALFKMQADPSSSIHIGDDYEKDIIGSQACGLKAYLVDAND